MLTANERKVLELRFGLGSDDASSGLTLVEIARRLGVTQQVIQKRIYGTERDGQKIGGALRKLREALAPILASAAKT